MLNAPFCPIKQKLRRNECEVSMVKIPQHKVAKFNKLFSGSFLKVFEQSDNFFVVAVSWLPGKLVKRFVEEVRMNRSNPGS